MGKIVALQIKLNTYILELISQFKKDYFLMFVPQIKEGKNIKIFAKYLKKTRIHSTFIDLTTAKGNYYLTGQHL